MNLNDLAKEICKREGKKVRVNIGQIKEILRITIDILNEYVIAKAQAMVTKNQELVSKEFFKSPKKKPKTKVKKGKITFTKPTTKVKPKNLKKGFTFTLPEGAKICPEYIKAMKRKK